MVNQGAVAAGAFVFGALVISVAFFMGPMIDTTYTDTRTAAELASNDSVTLHQNLDVETVTLDTNNDTIDVAVINSRTLERNTTGALSEGQNATLTVGGESVRVTHESWMGTSAIVSVEYSNTFGFDRGPKLFFENMGTLLAIISLFIVLMALALALRAGT